MLETEVRDVARMANQTLPNKGGLPASASDGTAELLRSGALIMLIGAVAFGLLMILFGGVGVEGAHSNAGWLALITGMMCLPFGLMLFVLGAAKWLRNRSLRGK